MNSLITNLISKVNKLEKNIENQTKKQEEIDILIANQLSVPKQTDQLTQGEKNTDNKISFSNEGRKMINTRVFL